MIFLKKINSIWCLNKTDFFRIFDQKGTVINSRSQFFHDIKNKANKFSEFFPTISGLILMPLSGSANIKNLKRFSVHIIHTIFLSIKNPPPIKRLHSNSGFQGYGIKEKFKTMLKIKNFLAGIKKGGKLPRTWPLVSEITDSFIVGWKITAPELLIEEIRYSFTILLIFTYFIFS